MTKHPAEMLRRIMEDPHSTHRFFEDTFLERDYPGEGIHYLHYVETPPNKYQVTAVNNCFMATPITEIPGAVQRLLEEDGWTEVHIEGIAYARHKDSEETDDSKSDRAERSADVHTLHSSKAEPSED